MKRFGEKALAAVLGLILVLALMEIGLRVVSAFFWRPTTNLDEASAPALPARVRDCDRCVRVLCLGDSFTYGFGATPGNDYPAQLQRILDEKRPEPFAVINGGRGGASTTNAMRILDKHIAQSPPDLVVLMIGNSNVLDFAGYLEHLHGSRFQAISDVLFNVRLLRYAWYASVALRDESSRRAPPRWPGMDPLVSLERVAAWKNTQIKGRDADGARRPALVSFRRGLDALRDDDLETAVRWFQQGIEVDGAEGANYYGMAVINQRLNRRDDAEGWFQAGLREAPDDPTLYDGLGELLIEKAGPWNPILPVGRGADPFTRLPALETWRSPGETTKRALATLETGIGVGPDYAGNHCVLGTLAGLLHNHRTALEELRKGIMLDPDDPRCYPVLIDIARLIGRRDEVIAFLEPRAGQSPTASRFLNILRSEQSDFIAWIRADIQEMVRRCKAENLPTVFMEYPANTTVNAVMSATAQQEGLLIVRNEAWFRDTLAKGTPFDALFVPDGHCNDAGYGVLARRLYDALESAGTLDSAVAHARSRWRDAAKSDELGGRGGTKEGLDSARRAQ